MTVTQQKLANIWTDSSSLIPSMPDGDAEVVFNILVKIRQKPERLSWKEAALDALMKHKGSVHLLDDRKAAKDAYLEEKYESLN